MFGADNRWRSGTESEYDEPSTKTQQHTTELHNKGSWD